MCCNEIWENKFVQQKKKFIAINSKYSNDNFDTTIYMLLEYMIYCNRYLAAIGYFSNALTLAPPFSLLHVKFHPD